MIEERHILDILRIGNQVVNEFSHEICQSDSWEPTEEFLWHKLIELQAEAVRRARGAASNFDARIHAQPVEVTRGHFYRWIGQLEGCVKATGEQKLFPYE